MIPDISVIIPAYNIETYITRAINSALEQKNVTLEVIVIDDASTDNTYQCAMEIEDPRLTVLRLENNVGASKARNVGLAQAKGHWIAVLDGDDVIVQNRFARLKKCAEERGADIVVDNLRVVSEDGGESRPMFDPEYFSTLHTLDLATFIGRKLQKTDQYSLGYLKPMFSHEFLKKFNLSWPENQRRAEDYTIMVRTLWKGALCAVDPFEGYYYTRRHDSTSVQPKALDEILHMIRVDTALQEELIDQPRALRAIKKRLSYFKEQYAFGLLVRAIKEKKIGAIFSAILRCPTCPRLLWLPIKKRMDRIGRAEK